MANEFDYQLDRHCSKTVVSLIKMKRAFDYQLDRHCSKTLHGVNVTLLTV